MNAEIAVTLMEELGLQIDRGKDGIRYVSAIEQVGGQAVLGRQT